MPPILAERPFLRATVMNFFFFLSLNGFVLLPLYIESLGGTPAQIGVVMGIYSAVGIVLQPLVGPWIDALGRKPFMMFGLVMIVVSDVIALLVPAVPALALVRALQGIGFSTYFVGTFSYVVDVVPPAKRGWALGIYGVSGLMATALAPLFGEMIVRRWGFGPLFTMCGLFALAAGAMLLRLRERERVEPRGPVTLPWEHGRLRDLLQRDMAITVFFGLGAGTLFAFLPTFAESLGVRTLALFYTAYSVAAMGVRILGGRLIDTRGRRAVIVPSTFLQAIATALLGALGLGVVPAAIVPALPILFLAGLLSGAAHGFLYPGLAALVTDRTPDRQRAAVVGVFSAVYLSGNAGGAFVFGVVSQVFGYGAMWTALTAALLGGAALSLGLAERGPVGQPIREAV